ncbi:hypothetical protein D9M68_986230 [compost metagenome]
MFFGEEVAGIVNVNKLFSVFAWVYENAGGANIVIWGVQTVDKVFWEQIILVWVNKYVGKWCGRVGGVG